MPDREAAIGAVVWALTGVPKQPTTVRDEAEAIVDAVTPILTASDTSEAGLLRSEIEQLRARDAEVNRLDWRPPEPAEPPKTSPEMEQLRSVYPEAKRTIYDTFRRNAGLVIDPMASLDAARVKELFSAVDAVLAVPVSAPEAGETP